MGSIWRSAPMHMIQLFIQTEAAHDTVDELGSLGLVEFVDLNPSVSVFQRHFVREVRRMEELGRKLRYFDTEIARGGMQLPGHGEGGWDRKVLVIDELETQFDDLEKDLRDISATYETLQRDTNELIELKMVLEHTDDVFRHHDVPDAVGSVNHDAEGGRGFTPTGGDTEGDFLLGNASAGPGQLGFVAGMIVRDKIHSFERILWRATRGNLFMRDIEVGGVITDPATGQDMVKNVVVIFFQGGQTESKIKRICDSRGVHLYPCPDNAGDRESLLLQVNERLRELRDVLEKSRAHRDQLLRNIAAQIHIWKAKIAREKAISDTMNLFNYDVGRKCLVAVGWCPVARTDDVQLALRRAAERSGALAPILSVVRTSETPPTHFETNKVTQAFHTIVSAYGVARYREINPSPFAVITFPFLFAMMFGDLGHGLVMSLFALGLILIEKRVNQRSMGEMTDMIFSARYMLLGMGVFSMYVGLLYNEAFAVGLDFFGGSRWTTSNDPSEYCSLKQWCRSSGVYPFGVDPSWKGSANEITFYNGIKMKASILFGVAHMGTGIVLAGMNAVFYGNTYDLLFVVIPSFLFFFSMFGYMSFLILLKWISVRSDGHLLAYTLKCNPSDPNCVYNGDLPKIMNVMIDMLLSPFSCCGDYKDPLNKYSKDRLYDFQPGVQGTLLIIIVLCVPVMLCCKPFWLWWDHKRRQKYQLVVHADEIDDIEDYESEQGRPAWEVSSDASSSPIDSISVSTSKLTSAAGILADDEEMPAHGGHGHGGEFNMGEIMMHQVIHSIEFILGSISNTASYLRLWALSLAHAELAVVFWERAMGAGFGGEEKKCEMPHTPTMHNATTIMGATTTMMSTTTTTIMSTVTEIAGTPSPTMAAPPSPFVQHATQTATLFVAFSGWLAATIGVLMVMEALSAFLHALRLHWVEFGNKFYLGDGILFQPFSFENLGDDMDGKGEE